MADDPTGQAVRVPAVADTEVIALRTAVARLRRELAVYRAELPDRAIAEEELASLAAVADAAAPEHGRLRQSLLVVAGALGSVSALSAALAEVRRTIDACTLPLPSSPPDRR